MPDHKSARILIVDDEPVNIRLLERTLTQVGYHQIEGTTDPRRALELYNEFDPDLILLDILMPYLDGFAVMERLQLQIPPGAYLPILVLTADINNETKQRALAAGAKDFLTKPFDRSEVLLRIANLLETRFLYAQLQGQNQMLEEKVSERTRALQEAQVEILERLALAAEYRDDNTGQHTRRVGHYAALIAQALGMSAGWVELIRRAAPLHDVGKIGIPDAILLKPDLLSDHEFDRVKAHTTIGVSILSGSRFALLKLAEEIALTHHERWDGGGYPAGLKGNQIPLAGRIVAVADVFDALTCDRPYKGCWSIDEAAAEIERQSGRQFDPMVVRAFKETVVHQVRAEIEAAVLSRSD